MPPVLNQDQVQIQIPGKGSVTIANPLLNYHFQKKETVPPPNDVYWFQEPVNKHPHFSRVYKFICWVSNNGVTVCEPMAHNSEMSRRQRSGPSGVGKSAARGEALFPSYRSNRVCFSMIIVVYGLCRLIIFVNKSNLTTTMQQLDRIRLHALIRYP